MMQNVKPMNDRRTGELLEQILGERGNPKNRAVLLREFEIVLLRLNKIEADLRLATGSTVSGSNSDPIPVADLAPVVNAASEALSVAMTASSLDDPMQASPLDETSSDPPTAEEYNRLLADVEQTRNSFNALLTDVQQEREISARLFALIQRIVFVVGGLTGSST